MRRSKRWLMITTLTIPFTLVWGLSGYTNAIAQEGRWTKLSEKTGQFIAQEKYAEGIEIAKEALRIAEKTFGSNVPNVAISFDDLATLYYAKGEFDQAEPLYKRALAIRERALGPDHPSVAISLNNLAGLYQAQGKDDQAEHFKKRAQEIWDRYPRIKEYLEGIMSRVLKVWRYPTAAEPGLRGKVKMEFFIERNGEVSRIKVLQGSGYSVLDKGAVESLHGASPFPPLPPEFKTNRLNIMGDFGYNIHPQHNE